jgi:hypothetical protein
MTRAMPLIAAAILLAATAPSRADFVVSIGNLVINTGGVGTLDVTLSSSDGTPMKLDSFGFDFEITRVSGEGRLEFTPTQNDPFFSSKYVFYLNSGDNTPAGQTPLGTVSSTKSPNDTNIGSDYTNDSANVSVTSSMLLAHLTFTDATSLPPSPHSTFQVALIRDSNTFFQYDSTTTPVADSFTVVGGLVTIVPEPSSLLLVMIGGLVVLIVAGWNSRRGVLAFR